MDSKHYSREIKMPKSIQDGTANHIQMIINEIENGDTNEALMLAVDLLDQLIGSEPALVVTRRVEPLDHKAIEEMRKSSYSEGFAAGKKQASADALRTVTARVAAALKVVA